MTVFAGMPLGRRIREMGMAIEAQEAYGCRGQRTASRRNRKRS
ncbi:hypothetical protein C806_03012 [Lachnospiraceae bacterium 3-1]|nr:hypothetical protein C806_03012 [Lachnospiraceae bacterium 3-1]